ncbi:ribonuclease HI [Nannocystis bainbridge]|uniref:ribonuclease H n=1 Tax=Nannocystis bainbridge TaxID=2995303 RepID=A0ABT5DVS1_9BACT|nr:ribonuclease H [Nannocystis bainbridge]MDC0717730.1 ribonuclease HI [Nannocystis bainbridge]
MAWKRFVFKDQTVFVRVLASGKPIVHRGRIEMRYRLGASKSYRATPDNLIEIPDDTEILSDDAFSGTPTPAATVQVVREEPTRAPTDDTIIIHTDGACSGNPGPAGIGVLIERGEEAVEHSEFIGEGTNNVAELTAILRALEMLRPEDKDAHVLLFTDSGWSLGVLVGGWKAKANLELIEKIKEKLAEFTGVELLKVRGHAGQPGNEEADALATMAVRREDSRTRTRRRSKSPLPAV